MMAADPFTNPHISHPLSLIPHCPPHNEVANTNHDMPHIIAIPFSRPPFWLCHTTIEPFIACLLPEGLTADEKGKIHN
ncbi:hypothetical protein KTT_08760 [Tengunoibacter tsumagoiensis]|uniref:Uncharacterized protein n=1 Tax=Tengunoibacter tsumagoiensis TaxID=2014871 RepID=A0A401ZVZ5_9CHLR|nr:hypothetical protein KTT_08760 [Tengunoibacter tsumagoiensis]